MMFDIIKVKTFQGDEYKICGDDKVVHLEWRPKPPHDDHDWDILYFKNLSDDGIVMCMLHLAEELKLLATENRMLLLSEEFRNQAHRLCYQVPHED